MRAQIRAGLLDRLALVDHLVKHLEWTFPVRLVELAELGEKAVKNLTGRVLVVSDMTQRPAGPREHVMPELPLELLVSLIRSLLSMSRKFGILPHGRDKDNPVVVLLSTKLLQYLQRPQRRAGKPWTGNLVQVYDAKNRLISLLQLVERPDNAL